MKFISREKSPGFIIKHGARKLVETTKGVIPIVVKAARIKFQPLGSPFKTSALPIKSYKDYASGVLNSFEAANKLRAAGHTWTKEDEEGNEVDVTEKEVISFLFNHAKYGEDFVAIGSDGKEIVDTIIVPEGDGGFYCRLCEQHFENAQGKDGHATSSNKHKKNIELANSALVSSLA